MNIKNIYLSICIPTYNRLDILYKTIESIYADLDDINIDDFEVVISDNEPNRSAKQIVEKFNYQNIHYIPTDCEGFLNSLNALQYGNGMLLKLHNNYTKLKKGSLKKLIDDAKQNLNKKPLIFYTDGLKQNGDIKRFTSFDSFMFQLSYFSSWSTGFSIWQKDLNNIEKNMTINNFFPQTSLLLSQTNKIEYIINDTPIFDNQNVSKKGGYNIFKVFSIDYIELIENSYKANEISKKSFIKIKNDLLVKYLSIRYFKTVIAKLDNFDKKDIKKSITKHYSQLDYYKMIFFAFLSPIAFVMRKLKIFFFNLKK